MLKTQRIMDKHLFPYPTLKFCITHNQDIVLFQRDDAADLDVLHVYDINGQLKHIFPPPHCQHSERWLNIQEINSGYRLREIFHDIAVSCCHPDCKEITLYNIACGTSVSAYKDNRKGRPAPGIMCQGERRHVFAIGDADSNAKLLQFSCISLMELQLVRMINLDQPTPHIMHYMKNVHNKHGSSFIVYANTAKRSFGVFDVRGNCTSWYKQWSQISPFLQPYAICSDEQGILYIANGDNNKILILDRTRIKVLGVLHYRKAKEIWYVDWHAGKNKLIVYCNDKDGKTRIRSCRIQITSGLDGAEMDIRTNQFTFPGSGKQQEEEKFRKAKYDGPSSYVKNKETLCDDVSPSMYSPLCSALAGIDFSEELQSSAITSSKDSDSGEEFDISFLANHPRHFSRYEDPRHRRHRKDVTIHKVSGDPQEGTHYVISSDDEESELHSMHSSGKSKQIFSKLNTLDQGFDLPLWERIWQSKFMLSLAYFD